MRYSSGVHSARLRAGISQAELAKRAGITQSAVSMIESKRRRPSVDAIEALARGMGVSPLAIYLLSANGHDVPRGTPGILLIGRISTLVDDLWRWRRNGNGQRLNPR